MNVLYVGWGQKRALEQTWRFTEDFLKENSFGFLFFIHKISDAFDTSHGMVSRPHQLHSPNGYLTKSNCKSFS